MPTRMIRDWTDSLRFDGLSAEAERLFVRLIMKADDYGRFHADTRLLKASCFPLLDNLRPHDLTRWLDELSHRQLILRYEAEGRNCLVILNYGQRLKSSRAKFPPAPGEPGDWLPDSDYIRRLAANRQPLPGSSRNFPEDPARREEKGRDLEEDLETEPEGVGTPSGGLPALVDAVWAHTPKLGRERSSRAKVEKVFARMPAKIRPSTDTLVDALARWSASESWTKNDGEFVPGIHRWVQDRQWENIPLPAGERKHSHAGIQEDIEF